MSLIALALDKKWTPAPTCRCGNPKHGFDCVCEWVTKDTPSKETLPQDGE